jgi:hypothetical protein
MLSIKKRASSSLSASDSRKSASVTFTGSDMPAKMPPAMNNAKENCVNSMIRSETAKRLSIGCETLYNTIKAYNIDEAEARYFAETRTDQTPGWISLNRRLE